MADAKEIARRLAGQAEAVAAMLVPGGKRVGHEWIFDPGHGQIKINLKGDRAGRWAHFGGEGKGDLLNLWMQMKGVPFRQAVLEAQLYLGIDEPMRPAERKTYSRPPKPPNVTKIQGRGTAVEQYLRGERAIPTEIIERFRIAEGAERRGKRDDGTEYVWKGPWIIFPYLLPKDGGGFETANLKWLHVERRKDPDTGKEKKVTVQEKNAEPCLFGWQALASEAEYLIITEGEIDAMSVTAFGFPALSVPMGAGAGAKHDWIDREWERLSRFREIYLCFDSDDEGKKAIEHVSKRIGVERIRVITLPHKDANKCLTEGMTNEAFAKIVSEAKTIDPPELRPASAFLEKVIETIHPTSEEAEGIRTSIVQLDHRFRYRRKEWSVYTGINGHGKSVFLGQDTVSARDQGYRSCIASLEMPPEKTLERITRQAAGKAKPSEARIRQIVAWLGEEIWFINRVGRMKPAVLFEIFRYARRRHNCDLFIIDSLMRCGISEEDKDQQADFADQITEFVQSEDCHLILVAHPRKGADETREVGKLDVKGAGTITDLTFNCVSLWRNKAKQTKIEDLRENKQMVDGDPELEKVKSLPDGMFIMDKQRYGSNWEGRVKLWFHHGSQTFFGTPERPLNRWKTLPRDPADQEAEEATIF